MAITIISAYFAAAWLAELISVGLLSAGWRGALCGTFRHVVRILVSLASHTGTPFYQAVCQGAGISGRRGQFDRC